MKINGFETNEVIIAEIGKRVKRRRIAFSMTQKELAYEADISLRTLSGFENGENISLSNLISILRVLRLLQEINQLIPENEVSPIDILKLSHSRKRVSTVNRKSKSAWKWGDEE
jgi:transcriptional regulator with XRE-family HTH domain